MSLHAVDRYLRRADTRLAGALRVLSPGYGPAYFASGAKRWLDCGLSLPAALLSSPIIVLLAALNRLWYPAHPPLFVQSRVGHGDRPLPVFKIRSLIPMPGNEHEFLVTGLGRLLRASYLDELPQFWQVLFGQLSLVGIRVLPRSVYLQLAATWSPPRFARWQEAYRSTPLSLSGIHQVFRRAGKEDERRFHRDVFYSGHAHLGLDLYVLWRTLVALARPRF